MMTVGKRQTWIDFLIYVSFRPNRGHEEKVGVMSAYDPERTFEVTFTQLMKGWSPQEYGEVNSPN